MNAQFEERLKGLKNEFEAGQKMVAELDLKRNNLQNTMLQISGAIQVLEELLSKATETPAEQ